MLCNGCQLQLVSNTKRITVLPLLEDPFSASHANG